MQSYVNTHERISVLIAEIRSGNKICIPNTLERISARLAEIRSSNEKEDGVINLIRATALGRGGA